MTEENRWLTLALIVMGAILIFMYSITFSIARDRGQWDNVDPELKLWFHGLKQPDNPNVSCCGEADSYYCDEHAKGDQVYCIINDDRDNTELMRQPVPNGTVIQIPPNKINRDGNMAGRAIVFLSYSGSPYCFIGAGGA